MQLMKDEFHMMLNIIPIDTDRCYSGSLQEYLNILRFVSLEEQIRVKLNQKMMAIKKGNEKCRPEIELI
jgi:hypothetical protein